MGPSADQVGAKLGPSADQVGQVGAKWGPNGGQGDQVGAKWDQVGAKWDHMKFGPMGYPKNVVFSLVLIGFLKNKKK